MANVRFEHLAEPLQGKVKKPTYFWVLKTFSPYTYVSVDGEVELNYNAYEWQNPKINWLPTDYFNVIDFERIVNNIDYVYNLALSLYPPFNHRYVDKDVEYTYIPHADTWNNISYNLRTINANTLNLSFGNYPTYVDNGKSPNYEMFNLWETHTQNLLEGLKDKAKLLPRLKCKLGAKQLGIRY